MQNRQSATINRTIKCNTQPALNLDIQGVTCVPDCVVTRNMSLNSYISTQHNTNQLQRSLGNQLLVGRANQVHYLQRSPDNNVKVLDQISLENIFDLYTTNLDKVSLAGKNFLRKWIHGHVGTAQLRGLIRARLSKLNDTKQLESYLSYVDKMQGNEQRKGELRALTQQMKEHAKQNLGSTTAPALIDVGHEGENRTFQPRRGGKKKGQIHAAMDAPGPLGTGVYAPLGGDILFSGQSAGYGNLVRVFHKNPPPTAAAGDGPLATNYAHLAQRLVTTGQQVQAGEAVGTMGNTTENAKGNSGGIPKGMGVHLHFSVQRVTTENPQKRLTSDYEARKDIHVKPDVWLNQLGINVAWLNDNENKKNKAKQEISLDQQNSNKIQRQLCIQRFIPEKFDLSPQKVTIIKGNKKKKKKLAQIQEAPVVYANAILKSAGLDAVDWFKNFTRSTFLGRPIAHPLHIKLAEHLKNVEEKFVEKYGNEKQADEAKPKRTKEQLAGDKLGLTNESIIGARKHPTSAPISMHLFGLAIDLNYTGNPFLTGNTFDKDKKGKRIEQFSPENIVLKKASQLVNGSEAYYKDNMSYEELSALSETLKTYFSYSDLANPTELKIKLENAKTEPWKGLPIEDAVKMIQEDLDKLTSKKVWDRKKTGQVEAIKRGGFLNLSKELIDGIGLAWGGNYGDMMHFDMRGSGDGAKIHRAIDIYKGQKMKEAIALGLQDEGKAGTSADGQTDAKQ